jgi:hypothetical protein
MLTLLVLVLLIVLLTGGGWWGYSRYGGPAWPVGAVMILLIVIVVWFAIPWSRPYP